MRATRMMPFIVIVDDGRDETTYSFRTEKQAKKFYESVQIGTNYKVGIYVSILKAKGKKK